MNLKPFASILVCFFTWLFYSSLLHAQNFAQHYQIGTEEYAAGICNSIDKGFIICGSYKTSTGYLPFVMKTDSLGVPEWTRVLQGSNISSGSEISQSAGGSIYFSGSVAGTSPSPGNTDAFLVKLNSNGDFVWGRSPSGLMGDNASQLVIAENGDILIAGNTTTAGMYAARFDTSGGLKWLRTFYVGTSNWLYDMAESPCGDILLAGEAGSGGDDAFLAKIDSAGGLKWAKRLGKSKADQARDISILNDSTYLLCGMTADTVDENEHSLLIKTDSSGLVLWSRRYDIGYKDWLTGVQMMDSATYILTGTHNNSSLQESCIVMAVDESGIPKWSNKVAFGYRAFVSEMLITPDSGIAFAGSFDSGYGRYYMAETDRSGNLDCIQNPVPVTTDTISLIVTSGISDVNYPMNPNLLSVSSNLLTASVTYLCNPNSIDEKPDTQEIELYPIPASGEISIRINPGTEIYSLAIMDLQGKKMSQVFDFTDTSLDVSQLPAGNYFLILQTSKGSISRMFTKVND